MSMLLLQVYALATVGAFSAAHEPQLFASPLADKSKGCPYSTLHSKTSLWMTNEDDNEKPTPSKTEERRNLVSKPPSPKKKKVFDPVQMTFAFMEAAYNVFVMAAGSFFTIGILLNLCGYAYKFTDDGFRVDTIEHMRMMNQFERAAREMAQEKSTSRPPSFAPNVK